MATDARASALDELEHRLAEVGVAGDDLVAILERAADLIDEAVERGRSSAEEASVGR